MTSDNFSQKSTLPNYRWIKFGMEYLNEPDFMQLSEGAAGAYLKLYLMAGRADAGGLLCNPNKVFSTSDLAWFLRCTPETISTHLDELSRAGLMAGDGSGYRIVRFLEEQGPGDNAERAKWRDRQDRARARARGELEPEPEQEPKREAEGEPEEEGEVDIESHGDVTVTQEPPPPPPPAAAASFPSKTDEDAFQGYWKAFTGRKLGRNKLSEFFGVIQEEKPANWCSRLRDCLAVWTDICKNHEAEGWSVGNPDAVMELFPEPNLEERMERETMRWHDAAKEKERQVTLRNHGLA